LESDAPVIPIGAVVRLDPVIGESGYVAAFRMVDANTGQVFVSVPAS
jgi:hypothetical protein